MENVKANVLPPTTGYMSSVGIPSVGCAPVIDMVYSPRVEPYQPYPLTQRWIDPEPAGPDSSTLCQSSDAKSTKFPTH